MKEPVLVTGAGGFLGTEICRRFPAGTRVIGADLPSVSRVPSVEWVIVEDGASLAKAVTGSEPATVIHAAFRNRKPPDWSEERYVTEAISDSTALFEAVAAVGAELLLVSSSAVYGAGGSRPVIDESTPPAPVSPYGRAKLAVEKLASDYAKRGMKLCIARLFNLIGPREQPGMLLSDWVRKVAALQNGETDAISVRHRRTARDFVDVRDAARALVLLAEHFEPGGVFNVASGDAVGLMEISGELDRLAGAKLPFVETDPSVDPTDVISQRGSSDKLRAAVGWRPEISWRQSLGDLWHAVASQKSTPIHR